MGGNGSVPVPKTDEIVVFVDVNPRVVQRISEQLRLLYGAGGVLDFFFQNTQTRLQSFVVHTRAFVVGVAVVIPPRVTVKRLLGIVVFPFDIISVSMKGLKHILLLGRWLRTYPIKKTKKCNDYFKMI